MRSLGLSCDAIQSRCIAYPRYCIYSTTLAQFVGNVGEIRDINIILQCSRRLRCSFPILSINNVHLTSTSWHRIRGTAVAVTVIHQGRGVQQKSFTSERSSPPHACRTSEFKAQTPPISSARLPAARGKSFCSRGALAFISLEIEHVV